MLQMPLQLTDRVVPTHTLAVLVRVLVLVIVPKLVTSTVIQTETHRVEV